MVPQNERRLVMDAWIFTHPDTWTRTEAPEWLEGATTTAYLSELGYDLESRAQQ
jgi:hypothetical protein